MPPCSAQRELQRHEWVQEKMRSELQELELVLQRVVLELRGLLEYYERLVVMVLELQALQVQVLRVQEFA